MAPVKPAKPLRPLKAIRAYCLECSGGSYKEAEICAIDDCPLYPYRMGKNPARKGCGNRAGKGGFAKNRQSHGAVDDEIRGKDGACGAVNTPSTPTARH